MDSPVSVPAAVLFEQLPDLLSYLSVLVLRQKTPVLVEVAAATYPYAVEKIFQRVFISQGVDQMCFLSVRKILRIDVRLLSTLLRAC